MGKIRIFVVSLMSIVIGIFLIAGFISDKIALSKGITDFNEMKVEDFKKGRIVEGVIDELDACFAEWVETKKGSTSEQVTSKYYLMPLPAYYGSEDYKYIVVCIADTSTIYTADKMVDEIDKYCTDGTEPIIWTTLEYKAKVSKLPKNVKELLYDSLKEAEWGTTDEECSQYVCPYYLKHFDEFDSTTSLFVGIGLLVVGVILFAVFILRVRR